MVSGFNSFIRGSHWRPFLFLSLPFLHSHLPSSFPPSLSSFIFFTLQTYHISFLKCKFSYITLRFLLCCIFNAEFQKFLSSKTKRPFIGYLLQLLSSVLKYIYHFCHLLNTYCLPGSVLCYIIIQAHRDPMSSSFPPIKQIREMLTWRLTEPLQVN